MSDDLAKIFAIVVVVVIASLLAWYAIAGGILFLRITASILSAVVMFVLGRAIVRGF